MGTERFEICLFSFFLVSLFLRDWFSSPAGSEAVGMDLESPGQLLKITRPRPHLGRGQQGLSEPGRGLHVSQAQSGPRTASRVFAATVTLLIAAITLSPSCQHHDDSLQVLHGVGFSSSLTQSTTAAPTFSTFYL